MSEDVAAAAAKQAKLDELRARREDLANAAAARLEPTIDELIAVEEKALADAEALDKAQAQHGARSIGTVQTELGMIVLRKPHVAAFRKFQDQGELKSDALEELVKSCLIHPSKAEYDRLMREFPAKLVECGNVAVQLAGQGAKVTQKK